MEERRIPETLEEAYRLRDSAGSLQERDFYQEQVYALRREEYRSRGIRTEISSRRRERQSALEFSREMFFLEVAEISGRSGSREARAAQHEARRYATRLDTHAFLKQLASPHSGAVELYRRNYLELLRMGKPPAEAYYLSRVIGLAGEGEFRRAAESVRESGYPTRGKLAYTVEKTAIQIRDLPGGMILILLTFFASLFAFVWATQTWDQAGAGTIFFVSLGLIAAGGLMLISAIFIVTFIRSINK
ncbi:hypothetical protein GBA63_03020 [Rubrobacter tropicus]|uniref:Uncharacterized protein n=1 Tax=Rubrobacter tropicus TaxID=2653851 RepID=A0A6G8Q5H2_9ACTN|nr:hypothetical protein [Rubrobacter tropicus]QIN81721.1 hypothetical protein GBA63_03020 [Rubrobacter tropicus]